MAKDLKNKSENKIRRPRDLLNRQSDRPTEKTQKSKQTLNPGDVEEVRPLKMKMMMR